MPGLLMRRAGAYVIDIILLFVVLFPIAQLLRLVIGPQNTAALTGLDVWLLSALNFSLPAWTYFALSDISASGSTVGKWLFGLCVVRITPGRGAKARAMARTGV